MENGHYLHRGNLILHIFYHRIWLLFLVIKSTNSLNWFKHVFCFLFFSFFTFNGKIIQSKFEMNKIHDFFLKIKLLRNICSKYELYSKWTYRSMGSQQSPLVSKLFDHIDCMGKSEFSMRLLSVATDSLLRCRC